MTPCRTYRITGTHEESASRMPVCYENHAQDSRVQGPIHVAPTFGHSNANSMGVSGNNPLIIQFLDKNAIIRCMTPVGQTATAIGFQPHHSAKARSVGARIEECPTLSTDFHISVCVSKKHPVFFNRRRIWFTHESKKYK